MEREGFKEYFKDVCVFFAILISKSVSRAIFRYVTSVFYLEISHTSYSRPR